MSTERKVAVITGASQGIGAGLVRGYLDHGYRVIANSRSIKPDASTDVLTVAGDITDPKVADQFLCRFLPSPRCIPEPVIEADDSSCRITARWTS